MQNIAKPKHHFSEHGEGLDLKPMEKKTMDRVKLQYFALDVTAGTWNTGYQGHPSLLSVGLPLCHLVMAVCSRLVSSSVASESCQTLDLEPKKKPKRMFHTRWFPQDSVQLNN